jgi:hypothetical protein
MSVHHMQREQPAMCSPRLDHRVESRSLRGQTGNGTLPRNGFADSLQEKIRSESGNRF